MIKQEIKEVFVSFGNVKELRALRPFSVGELIEENFLSDKSIDNSDVTFNAYMSFDKLADEGEYVFLRLRSLGAGSEIDFNGETISVLTSGRAQLTLDITSHIREGVNTIAIRARGAAAADLGIFTPIEILRTSYAIVDKITVNQQHENGKVTLSIKLDTLGASESVRAVATLVSGSGQIYYGGITRGRGSVTVTDPLYWWPKGLGVQNLYKLSVNVYGDMEVEDGVEMRIGIRRLTTAKSADGALFEINGTSLVPMGLVYDTPKRRYVKNADIVLESQIAAAARAGVNTIVIPSSADMPQDKLFELCDLYGIIAVRECADISAEADALARLSYHASVGLVDIVEAGEDVYEVTESLRRINQDFEFSIEDKPASYPSVKSLASYKTLCERLEPSERNLLSEKVERDADGCIVDIIALTAKDYLYASNIYDFAYISQLSEAARAEEAVMRARVARGATRAVFSSLGRALGVVGDGLLDFSLRHKVLSYKASEFFAPTVAYARMMGSTLELYASNESRADFDGVVEYAVIDSKNKVIHKEEQLCRIDFSTSRLLFTRDLGDLISGHENEYYVEYSLKSGSNTIYKNTLLLAEPKRFKYEDPEIEAYISGSDKKYSITISAKAFAQGVELDFLGCDAVFNDNYFDITSSAPMKISFNVLGGVTTAEKLQSELRIKSVYDIGKSYI